MKNARDIAGYLIGLLLFVILIPLLMWKISGEVHPGTVQIICLIVLAAAGIGLSIWSIVYMKNVGKGNPNNDPSEVAFHRGPGDSPTHQRLPVEEK